MSFNIKTIYIISTFILIFVYGFFNAIAIVKTDQWRMSVAKEYLYEANKLTNDTEKMILMEKVALLIPSEKSFLDAGTLALKIGDSSLAEKYLSRVKTAEGYYQLGNAYYNLEKHDLAIDNYQKSLKLKDDVMTSESLGKSYLKIGDLEKARNYFLKAEKSEEIVSFLVLLGVDIDKFGVSPSSASLRAGKRETNPANKVVLAYNEFVRLGYPQSANTVLDRATQNGQLNRDSLIALANSEIKSESYQTAYKYLVRAKLIDPYYPQIYQQLVIVCEKLGKVDEAKGYQDLYSQLGF